MRYVKIYRNTKRSSDRYVIGVINAELLENINWYIRPDESGNGEYQIHGMYYGSTADVDFSLNIAPLTSLAPGSPSEVYSTEGQRNKIMNIMVDGITKACQKTYNTATPVVDWYPPFNVGNSFVLESNPFNPMEEYNPPGEEYLGEKGLIEEPPGIPEGPFEGPGGPHMG